MSGRLDFEAAAFASGEALLSSDALSRAVCVLADVRMPGMSGFDLLRRLAARRPTGADGSGHRARTPDERSRALAIGATDYLAKPLRAEELSRCLRRLGVAGDGTTEGEIE